MLPKILKNFNAFVDGKGFAGRIEEIQLPKLTLKTEEFRAGGMDVPVQIDLGMEKMEAELTFAEYDPDMFRLFGITGGSTSGGNAGISFTLRGGMQSTGSAESVVINLRGIIKELDAGTWKAGEKSTLKCIVAAHYYRLTIGGGSAANNHELIEIDAENMIRKINGSDQLSSLRSAIGI
jgi:P2 family phage contractile tail tube protein